MNYFKSVPFAMKGKFNNLAVLCALSLGLFFSSIINSEETTVNDLLDLSLEELLNYEVSAPTKGSTRLSDTPGSVSVITYDQIRNSGASSIPELLRLVPGVHVRWNPMVQSIEIRSFGSNPFTSRVLLLIDGIPYNSWNKGGFPQHPGFDFFNLENVKHLEVIRGPGSALYGENALNGVINIVTLSGDEYRQTRISVAAGNRNTRSGSISHGSKIGQDGSIFVSARSETTQLPTAFWDDKDAMGEDFFLKGKYKDFQLSYYRRQDEFEGYDELIVPPDFSFRSTEKIAQNINIVAVNYNKAADDKSWSFKANASYADRDGTHCGGCHAVTQSESFNKSLDHGYQKLINAQLGLHKMQNHDLLIGVEARENSSGGSFTQISGIHDNIEVESYTKSAIFIQDRMSFNDDRLKVVAGLRYDSETSPDLFEGKLFPRLALVQKLKDKLTLRAGWSIAARYPSFTELYQNIRFFAAESPSGEFAFPPTNFQPNPDLELEMIESFEVGLQYQFNKGYQAKIDFFYNEVEDPIVLSYGTNDLGFENHPNDARVKGVEVEFRAQPNTDISVFANWSYQLNHQVGNSLDSNGLPLEFSYSPRNKFNMGLNYKLSDNIKSSMEVSWRDKTTAPKFWNDIVYGDGENHVIDPYAFVNLRFRYRLPIDIAGNRQPLTLSIFAKNITDEKQSETLIGVDGAALGREFFIGIDYEWAN